MKTVEQWLTESPFPVVGRIITSHDDARMIAISAAAYNKETLLVIPIETLQQLINSIRKP